MRIPIRTSRLATWARRLASFAVPLVIAPVPLLHLRLIETTTFDIAELIGGSIALLAVILAVLAFVRLWQSGDQGWGRAAAAFVIGVLLLLPFVWFGSQMRRYPNFPDITTPADRPPALEVAAPPVRTTLGEPEQIKRAFPNVQTRRYPLPPEVTFALVQQLVEDHGWDVLTTRPPAGVETEGTLNAVATTLLGWREEAALRISPVEGGSVVDMRSASVDRREDFGSNGRRIEEFLLALDEAATAERLNTPALPEIVEGTEELGQPEDQEQPEG